MKFTPYFHFVLCIQLWLIIPAFQWCYLISRDCTLFYSWPTHANEKRKTKNVKTMVLKVLKGFFCLACKRIHIWNNNYTRHEIIIQIVGLLLTTTDDNHRQHYSWKPLSPLTCKMTRHVYSCSDRHEAMEVLQRHRLKIALNSSQL